MVPKTWPWYATSPSIWSAKSLTSDRSSAAESAPPGTRNTCWKSSARCGRNLVNLDSLPCIQTPVRPIFEFPEEDFDQVMAINIRGVFLGMKYVLPRMREGGSVVNMSSALGVVGGAGI